MHRLWVALRIFFKTLFNVQVAEQVERLLIDQTSPAPVLEEPEAKAEPKPPAPPAKPLRSEALTLLAALQREGRFLDFIQEDLSGYSDGQIGAAARDVHRECGQVLERMFAFKPIVDEQEGATLTLPHAFDAGRYRLTGDVASQSEYQGTLVHHGWEATRCELPEWTGSEESARVIAPAELELKRS